MKRRVNITKAFLITAYFIKKFQSCFRLKLNIHYFNKTRDFKSSYIYNKEMTSKKYHIESKRISKTDVNTFQIREHSYTVTNP